MNHRDFMKTILAAAAAIEARGSTAQRLTLGLDELVRRAVPSGGRAEVALRLTAFDLQIEASESILVRMVFEPVLSVKMRCRIEIVASLLALFDAAFPPLQDVGELTYQRVRALEALAA